VLVGRLGGGLAWPPEIWGGAIIFSILVGLLLEAGYEQSARLAENRVRAAG
jgi:hypothetical protein